MTKERGHLDAIAGARFWTFWTPLDFSFCFVCQVETNPMQWHLKSIDLGFGSRCAGWPTNGKHTGRTHLDFGAIAVNEGTASVEGDHLGLPAISGYTYVQPIRLQDWSHIPGQSTRSEMTKLGCIIPAFFVECAKNTCRWILGRNAAMAKRLLLRIVKRINWKRMTKILRTI